MGKVNVDYVVQICWAALVVEQFFPLISVRDGLFSSTDIHWIVRKPLYLFNMGCLLDGDWQHLIPIYCLNWIIDLRQSKCTTIYLVLS